MAFEDDPAERCHWVTPTLFVGMVPEGVPAAVAVAGAEQALAAIHAGKVAVLPSHAWGAAETVLTCLGLSPEQVEDRIRFARGEAGPHADIRLDA